MADNPLSLKSKFDFEDSIRLFEFYKPLNWRKFNKFLKKSPLVIYGGGDIVNDNFTCMSFLHLTKILGLPLIVWGVGVVPIKSSFLRHYSKMVLNHAQIIGVRDENSKNSLEKMGVTRPPIKVTNDLALQLSPNLKNNYLLSYLNDIPTGSLKIGLNIRNFDDLYSSHIKWQEEDLLTGIASICNHIMDKFNAYIIFLPMVIQERLNGIHPEINTDDEIMKKLIPLLENQKNTITLKEDYNPEDLLGLITNLDLIISMRLHTLIFGVKTSVPIVGFNYAPKIEAFMSSIGLSDYILDLATVTDPEKIDEPINRLDHLLTQINREGYNNYEINLKMKEGYDEGEFKKILIKSMEDNQKNNWKIHFFYPLMVIISAENYIYQSIILIKSLINQQINRYK
jgi:polysaccharide pyruvyl transferase WcaK-like protein